MKMFIRTAADKIFTWLTGGSVAIICIVLVLVLGPMLWKGSKAIVFTGTVEFRKMQLSLYDRGDEESLRVQRQQTDDARRFIYERIDTFKTGVDAEVLCGKAREAYQKFSETVSRDTAGANRYVETKSLARELRGKLEEAFRSSDRKVIEENLAFVMKYKGDERFTGQGVQEFFKLAERYTASSKGVDLGKRADYAREIAQVDIILRKLLGPRPGEPLPALAMEQFGATRMDQVEKYLDELLWETTWEQKEAGKPLVAVRKARAEAFAGTVMEPVFAYARENIPAMMQPRKTFYWQFFVDDSTPGHFFGGVGPEILGTLLITLVGMAFALPLGVISAAYLVEAGSDNMVVRVIRLCINTLAGVPSIVFGLFGLAFFVLYLFPLIGLAPKANMLAAGLTLAVLTLPVMIRASEEAISAVPQTYKEASLALGAGRFRTFVSVTLPAAMPGVLTGAILSLSRIAGETAPILFTGAVALGPIPRSLLDPTRTLSYGSYDMAVGDRIAMTVPHQQFGMVMTLVGLILLLNGAAILLRGRMFRKLRGH
jgi:phosphate transport system permease protein